MGALLAIMGNSRSPAEAIKQLAEEVQNPVSDLARERFTNGTFFGARANDQLTNLF